MINDETPVVKDMDDSCCEDCAICNPINKEEMELEALKFKAAYWKARYEVFKAEHSKESNVINETDMENLLSFINDYSFIKCPECNTESIKENWFSGKGINIRMACPMCGWKRNFKRYE